MSREIKFRFWTGIEMRQPNLNTFLLSTSGSVWWQFGYDDIKPIPDWIPMQYTGLKDKNGIEIWEGDIVKTNYYTGTPGKFNRIIGAVTFGSPSFRVYGVGKYEGMRKELHSWTEIIGNIHQNPELL